MSIALIVRRIESMQATYQQYMAMYSKSDLKRSQELAEECATALQALQNMRTWVTGKQSGLDVLSSADQDAYSRTAALRADGKPMLCSACGESFVSEGQYRGHYVMVDRYFSGAQCPWKDFPWPTYYTVGE